MMFSDIISQYEWEEVKDSIYTKTVLDVEKAIYSKKPDLEDFKALISPASERHLETMAQKSHFLTKKRFGNTIQLYIPVYLSNECTNHCVYCGFNHENKIKRITLTEQEIQREAEAIKKIGFEHVLLVTGEAGKKVGIDYFKKAFDIFQRYFSLLSVEVQPLKEEEYRQLVEKGLHTVYLYQETYNEKKYKDYHPRGKKSNFHYRLQGPDRLGKAGVHKIGLGSLIGLEDWRTEMFFIALHLKYLQKQYWKTKYSVSFPRLRPHTGGYEPNYPMNDKELLQAICAFRIFDEDLEISLSTREKPKFRDHMIKLGITAMSAESKTNPGGYACYEDSLEQFEISDNRKATRISELINKQGYEAVWKDWDTSFSKIR